MVTNKHKSVEMKGLTLSLLHLPLAFAFCILNLNFLPKFGIFPIHIFEFPAKKLDSIGVVVGGGGGGGGEHESRFLEAPFVRMRSMRSASLKICMWFFQIFSKINCGKNLP